MEAEQAAELGKSVKRSRQSDDEKKGQATSSDIVGDASSRFRGSPEAQSARELLVTGNSSLGDGAMDED